jgi:hypothetical protein
MIFPRARNALWSSPNLQQYGEKKHACRYVDINTADLGESIPEFDVAQNFEEFKSAVHKLYPGSESERKWTIVDMDKLVGEQLRMGILDLNDLGNYYRMFYSITKFAKQNKFLKQSKVKHLLGDSKRISGVE